MKTTLQGRKPERNRGNRCCSEFLGRKPRFWAPEPAKTGGEPSTPRLGRTQPSSAPFASHHVPPPAGRFGATRAPARWAHGPAWPVSGALPRARETHRHASRWEWPARSSAVRAHRRCGWPGGSAGARGWLLTLTSGVLTSALLFNLRNS